MTWQDSATVHDQPSRLLQQRLTHPCTPPKKKLGRRQEQEEAASHAHPCCLFLCGANRADTLRQEDQSWPGGEPTRAPFWSLTPENSSKDGQGKGFWRSLLPRWPTEPSMPMRLPPHGLPWAPQQGSPSSSPPASPSTLAKSSTAEQTPQGFCVVHEYRRRTESKPVPGPGHSLCSEAKDQMPALLTLDNYSMLSLDASVQKTLHLPWRCV